MKIRLGERFWSKVNVNGPVHPVLQTRCWEWLGATDDKGYGRFGLDGHNTRAHRAIYTVYTGEVIPRTTNVCHRCDNPKCVRPTHHFFGTNVENNRDRDTKGRCRSGIRERQKTHCKYGHEFTPENTRVVKEGRGRNCITCERTRALARYYRLKGAA